MPKTTIAACLASFIAAQPAVAATTGSVLQVHAEVSPSAVLRIETRDVEIRVSEADLARGYVEVPTEGMVRVEAGRATPAAVLEFDPSGGPFRSMAIGGSAGQATYRLGIAEDARPGRYTLPLGLTINF